MKRTLPLLSLGVALALSTPAVAQQTPHAASGTQPSPGVAIFRQQAQYKLHEGVDRFELETRFAYGLTRNTALMTHIPLVHQNQDAGFVGDEGWGVEDIDVMLQHRFLQRDLGPLSTQRASVQLGVEVPTFDDFSSDSFDPFVGVAFTQVIQRVGLGAYGRVKLNTGNDDTPTHLGDTRHNAAFFGASALYRVDPPRFSVDENIGTYLVAEVNGVAEADGDYSLWFSPSVMVEAPTWTFEAAVRLPLLEDVGEARELEVGFTLGFRVFF